MKVEDLFSIYNHFRGFYTKNSRFQTTVSASSVVMMENFFMRVKDKYGNDCGSEFFQEYFLYQFFYWHDKKTRFGNIPLLNWCVGKVGFERFVDKLDTWKYWCRKKMEIPPLISIGREEKTFGGFVTSMDGKKMKEVVPWDEEVKKRFYGTGTGYLNCLSFVVSYNKRSVLCTECKYRKKCKKVNKNGKKGKKGKK